MEGNYALLLDFLVVLLVVAPAMLLIVVLAMLKRGLLKAIGNAL